MEYLHYFLESLQDIASEKNLPQIGLGQFSEPQNVHLLDEVLSRVNRKVIFDPESDFLKFKHRELVDGVDMDLGIANHFKVTNLTKNASVFIDSTEIPLEYGEQLSIDISNSAQFLQSIKLNKHSTTLI